MPLVVKAAVGHYQFETLHPFSDGNGRLGRLIVVLQMIEANIKVKDSNPNKPTLRKRTTQNKGGNTSPSDPNSTSTGGSTTSSDPSSDDSDRPTLQHRTTDPDQQQPQQ